MTGADIQSLPSGLEQAKRLARRLDVPVREIEVHEFPDGEMRVTVSPGIPATIIYAPLDHPNDKLLAILLAAEALRRNGARRLVLAAPYLCYMRQDAAFRAGEAISQKVVGTLLANAVDRIVTVDAHLHRTPDIRAVFPGAEAHNLSAMPAIAEHLRLTGFDPRTVVIGPDEESRPWVTELAGRLGVTYTVARKLRRADRSVEITLTEPAAVTGRPALLVDDIVSSGGTLMTCARMLTAAGADRIDAVVTHALFPPALLNELASAGIRSVRSTDSVPHPTNAIRLDGVLADALRNECRASAAEARVP